MTRQIFLVLKGAKKFIFFVTECSRFRTTLSLNPPAFRSPNTLTAHSQIRLQEKIISILFLILPFFFLSKRPCVIKFPQNCTIALLQRSEGRTKSESRGNILCQLEFPPAEQKQTADCLVRPHSPTSLSFVCRCARWAAGISPHKSWKIAVGH